MAIYQPVLLTKGHYLSYLLKRGHYLHEFRDPGHRPSATAAEPGDRRLAEGEDHPYGPTQFSERGGTSPQVPRRPSFRKKHTSSSLLCHKSPAVLILAGRLGVARRVRRSGLVVGVGLGVA